MSNKKPVKTAPEAKVYICRSALAEGSQRYAIGDKIEGLTESRVIALGSLIEPAE